MARVENERSTSAVGRAAARPLPRDAPHPALRGEGRGALPRRRAAGLPARRDRPGGGRGRRLRGARAGRRDRLDAPRARAHDREGHARRTRSWPSSTASRRAARAATAARCTSTTSSAATSARTRSWAAACRRSSARRSRSSSAASSGSRSRSSATARRTSARSTSRSTSRSSGRCRPSSCSRTTAGPSRRRLAAPAAPIDDLASGPRRSACARSRSTGRTSRPSTRRPPRRASTPSPGKGRCFLDVRTYRLVGHYVGDPQVYRAKEELEEARETQDPIDKLRARLELSDEEFEELEHEVDRRSSRRRSSSPRTAPTRSRGFAPEERLCLS